MNYMHRIDSNMPPLQHSSLAALGEFGLISRITSAVSPGEGVITGIGDDAAVTSLSPGMQLLVSTDMLVEDVHFDLGWHDPSRLGRKSLAVNISDIAAMGGIPRWVLLSLALPSDLPLDFIDRFMRGFLGMAAEHRVALIGGDTCSSRSGLSISVTVMGEQAPELILRRSGALPDDDIWVTGTLGDAALGLKVVQNGGTGDDYPVSRLLDPSPRVSAALALAEAGVVTAMIDVSDGILADFGHIAEQSHVGGCIYRDDLPLSAGFRSHTADLSEIPYQLALSGGEDYELCFTAHRSNRKKIVDCMKKSGIAVTRVGIVINSPGVAVLCPDGTRYEVNSDGFNHFT